MKGSVKYAVWSLQQGIAYQHVRLWEYVTLTLWQMMEDIAGWASALFSRLFFFSPPHVMLLFYWLNSDFKFQSIPPTLSSSPPLMSPSLQYIASGNSTPSPPLCAVALATGTLKIGLKFPWIAQSFTSRDGARFTSLWRTARKLSTSWRTTFLLNNCTEFRDFITWGY